MKRRERKKVEDAYRYIGLKDPDHVEQHYIDDTIG